MHTRKCFYFPLKLHRSFPSLLKLALLICLLMVAVSSLWSRKAAGDECVYLVAHALYLQVLCLGMCQGLLSRKKHCFCAFLQTQEFPIHYTAEFV